MQKQTDTNKLSAEKKVLKP